ncbi:hypothetical protein CPB97_004014, partial [Podila verticillata]
LGKVRSYDTSGVLDSRVNIGHGLDDLQGYVLMAIGGARVLARPVELVQTEFMSIFKSNKSNKNKTASAATTPAQTPRSSLQTARPASSQANVMTREQALESLMRKTVGSVPFNYLH